MMKLQTSVLESRLKNTIGSPCRVLQGNQANGTVSYKNSTILKRCNGITPIPVTSYDNKFIGPIPDYPFPTNYDLLLKFNTLYQIETDVYKDSFGNTYTGISSIDLAHNCPTSSGYPSGFTDLVLGGSFGEQFYISGGAPTGSSQIFAPNVRSVQYSPGSIGNAGPGQVISNDPAILEFALFYDTPASVPVAALNWNIGSAWTAIYFNNDGTNASTVVTSTITGPLDFSPYYTTAKNDLLSQAWNWGINPFALSYNEPTGGAVPALPPSSYDLSLRSSAGSGGSILNPFPCVNGWTIFLNASSEINITLSTGLAKNTTNSPQPYFIGRVRVCNFIPNAPGPVVSGVTTTLQVLEMVSSGIIQPNQVIGIGQDIALPFPSSNPFPFIELGNNVVIGEAYFAVIGQDPNSFGPWGTTTTVTP